MKKITLALATLFILTLFSSCEKAITLNRLEGDWDVTSFIIDGDEEMEYYDSFEMEFSEYDDNEGDVQWLFTEKSGDAVILDGTYEINDAADELEVIFRVGSDVLILDAEIGKIDREEITLEGFLDGGAFRIKADKK
jgi:hypothetical protein